MLYLKTQERRGAETAGRPNSLVFATMPTISRVRSASPKLQHRHQ